MSITKVSDIAVSDLVEYLRIPDASQSDETLLGSHLNVAKEYIKSYTGQSNLDTYTDMVYAVLVLVQDMWDTRTLYVDKGNVNRTVESILNLHSINLLPVELENEVIT